MSGTSPVVPGAGQWLGGRRSSGLAAVAVVALVLVVVLAAWLRSGDGTPRGAPGTPVTAPAGGAGPAGAAAATATAGVAAAASAGRPVATPVSPPPGVVWQGWHAVALPYSSADGPRTVKGDVASGFSRTPTGALLASVHAAWRLAGALDPDWRNVVGTMVAAGPGRDRWVAARQGVHLTATQRPGAFAQVAGFQLISYNEDDAAVQLVSASDSRLTVQAVHMRWVGGDWKLVMTPGGGTGGPTQVIGSLDGFVAWGATR